MAAAWSGTLSEFRCDRDFSISGAEVAAYYFAAAFFFFASARRSVFFRRFARFLALSLPLLCPINVNFRPVVVL